MPVLCHVCGTCRDVFVARAQFLLRLLPLLSFLSAHDPTLAFDCVVVFSTRISSSSCPSFAAFIRIAAVDATAETLEGQKLY